MKFSTGIQYGHQKQEKYINPLVVRSIEHQ